MASRHMNYLRKHQKVILAVMGVVCMVTFVIGSSIESFISSARSSRQDPVVVTWVGGKIHEGELDIKATAHQIAVNFLRMLIVETIERGGSPVVNGQTIPKDATPAQIAQMDPGIFGDASESTIVRMELLAKKADELGIVVDQEAAREFLRALCYPEIQDAELPALALRVMPEQMRMSYEQLLDQIAFDLKSQHMAMLSQAGLYAMPPAQMWEYHNRLNRRVVVEAYPVEVQPLVDQVKEAPTDAELRTLFEEGKHRDPNPALAEPGFHRPAKAAFAWLKIDFKPFLDAAKTQITAEQVAQQYELDKTQGKHKVLELPMDPTKPAEDKPGESKPDEAKPDEAKPDEAKPGEAKPGETKPDAPASEKPAEARPAEVKPAEEKPAEEKPAAENPADAAKPEEKPGCSDDPPASDTQAAEEKPAEEKPAEEKPSEEKPAEKPAEPAAETRPADTKPVETKPAEASTTEPGKPADAAKPADPTQPADPVAAAPATPAAPPKFKPLAEVEDEIRAVLARPIAQKEMDAAIEKVRQEVGEYGRKARKFHDSQEAAKAGSKAKSVADPGPLDLQALAERFNFEPGSTELVDRFEVATTDIGQKVMEFDMQSLQNRQFTPLSFADLAFGRNEVLYDPQLVNSTELDVNYLYWRTAEQEASDPTFEEAREAVVAAWKLQKAFELAKTEAQKLADKAKSAAKLADVVEPEKVKTTAPFSWLTTGSLAFGFSEPSLSSVPEIDLAGVEFMQSVFDLKAGQTGIAPNQSHRIVYVVRVVNQEPEESVLREQFLESGGDFQSIIVARSELSRTSYEWFQGLEKEMGLVKHRPLRSPNE